MDMMATPIAPMHDFALREVTKLIGVGGRVLDFGCGSGVLTLTARAHGIDMVGSDIFYGGSDNSAAVRHRLGKTVFAYTDRIPFPDGHFDAVVANQVFEHVEDAEAALSEIRRVLKPGGAFLNIFPTIGVLREGHVGVPLAHWLNGVPRMQIAWLWMAHLIGAGYHRAGESRSEWARRQSAWLRAFTVYRTYKDTCRLHLRYFSTIAHIEHQLIAQRCRQRGWPARWCSAGLGKLVASIASRRLATMAIVLH